MKTFQIGRIHHRQLLDDDQRDVRLFQEAFLEDGELHSENGRTRRFKWKDTGSIQSYYIYRVGTDKLN